MHTAMHPRAACLLGLALLALAAVPLLASGQACVESPTSRFTSSAPTPTPIALGQRSRYALTTLGRARAGVRIFDLQTSLTVPAAAVQRTCATSAVPANGAAYSPEFGRALAVASDSVAAIGAPNRYALTPAYSAIDVFQPSAVISAGGGSSYASVASTISSQATNDLGALLALDATQPFLASTFDASRIVVFSPLFGRQSPEYDSATSGTTSRDAMATVPSGFQIDSFAVQDGVLLVSGVATNATSQNCVPQVLAFQYTNGTSGRAWLQLGQTYLLRDPTKPASADANAVPCLDEPSAAYPLDLSYDAKQLIVGAPAQACAYSVSVTATFTSQLALAATARCATDAQFFGENFGASVAFTSKEDGSAFTVASSQSVTQFTRADWTSSTVNPLDQTTSSNFYQFPNRMQPGPTKSCTPPGSTVPSSARREILSVVSRSDMSILLYAPLTAPTASDLMYLRPQSSVPAGSQWNPLLHQFELCPAGRISTGTGSAYSGCAFCLPGEYQSQVGQQACLACSSTAYCPAGSISGGYSVAAFTPATAVYSSTPWFEYESYREVFEELLIGTVFSVAIWPAMIIFFVLTGICFAVYVASYWAPADGDERDCCSSPGTCCLHTYRLLGRFKFFTQGRTGPFPYAGRSAEVVPDVIAFNAKGEEVRRGVEDQQQAGRRGPPRKVTQVKNEDGSITTTTEVQPAFVQVHQCEEDSPEFAGYMQLVFILFALAAVSYTGLYLASYDPSKQEATRDQNVYRTRNEYQRSSVLEPETAQSIEALLANAFDISLALVGTSVGGVSSGCNASLVRSFDWVGCTYPNLLVSGGSPVPCANLLATATYAADDGTGASDAASCRVTLHFPSGTDFPSLSTFTLALRSDVPSSSIFQALRLSLAQNATAIALALPETGSTGSSANDKNTAAVAGYTFRQTLIRRGVAANSPVLLPVAAVNRRWLIMPVAYRTQRTSSWSNVFDSTWYSTVSDVDTPILPAVAPAAFQYPTFTSGSFCPAAVSSSGGLTVTIEMVMSPSFTINQTQRLIGENSVVLTMVLGVLAIYHLVHFVESLFKIAYHACCHRVHKGLIGAAQSNGATGPTANGGGAGEDGGGGGEFTRGAALPAPQSSIQRWQVPPEDYTQQSLPPVGPMYMGGGVPPPFGGGYPTGGDASAGWSGFEPSLHPVHNPGPNYYDGSMQQAMRARTPGPPLMPMTPGVLPPVQFRGQQQQQLQRRPNDFTPYTQRSTPTRERFDDPRIAEMEMSTQQRQRGGFEM